MTAAVIAGVLVLAAAAVLRVTWRLADRRVMASRLTEGRGAAVPTLAAPPRFAVALANAAVGVPADAAWTAWVAAVVLGMGVALLAGGPALAVVAMFAFAGGPALGLAGARGRSARLVDAALPGVLDVVTSSLRSGATLRRAVAEAADRARGRLADDLRAVVTAVDGGMPLVVALDAWSARCPTPGVRLAVAALALSAEAGGAAASAVDGVAATLRSNLAVTGEVRAQSSQARLSGLVIALAPLAFGALAAGTDRRMTSFLLRTPAGLGCLVGGLGLDALAAWWMHRITTAPV